jgi:SchA/CurD like domain-containing protein
MAFAAISYQIKTGHEDEIADIFSVRNFRRARSPIIRGAGGVEIGRIIGTGLFLQTDRMVRIIQYDGDVDDVARHMAAQLGVREAERSLGPYLRVPRDTDTPEGFLRYFRSSLMRCLVLRVFEDRPVAGLLAVRDEVHPERVRDLDVAVRAGTVQLVPGSLGGPVRPLAAGAFLQGTTLVRMVQHARDEGDALHALADPDAVATERALAPYLLDPPPWRDPGELLASLQRRSMRCIGLLSVASLLEGQGAGPAVDRHKL